MEPTGVHIASFLLIYTELAEVHTYTVVQV